MRGPFSGEIPMQMEEFAVQRLKHWSQIYLSTTGPMMQATSEVQFAQYLDQHMEHVVRVMAETLKGETTTESKTKTYEFTFDVFATWWDHLKYDLRERRLLAWLPKRLNSNLRVNYQKVVKSKTCEYPVAMTRSCPHAMVDWSRNPGTHLRFLLPREVEEREQRARKTK